MWFSNIDYRFCTKPSHDHAFIKRKTQVIKPFESICKLKLNQCINLGY